MQGPLDLVLPRQRMDELVQTERGLQVGESLAVVVEEFEVGHQPERVAHGDDAGLQADPVPRDAGGAGLVLVAPERLPGAKAQFVAEAQDSRAEVRQMQLRCMAGLPQYGRPCAYDPSRSRGDLRVDVDSSTLDGIAVWQARARLQTVRVVRVMGKKSRCWNQPRAHR